MRIKTIDAVHVSVPLDSPYAFHRGAMTAFESVIVRMVTDDGTVGYGESAPLFKSACTPTAITRTIIERISPALVGRSPFDVETAVEQTLELAEGNVDVVAGVDLALWDLMGKSLGQPAYRFLGGLCQDPIPVDYTLSAGTPDEMMEAALRVQEEGYRGVVVKATGESLEEDVKRVGSVRRALLPESTVRVDCNGCYAPDEAIRFLKAIADIDIELVEQPVAAGDVDGLRACREVGIPIAVDESLKTQQDALMLISRGACDIMNIKVANVGGLLFAKRMAAIASAAGLRVVVGGRTSLELLRCASRHFAASTPGTVGRKHEGPGPASQALSDDVVARRTTIQTAAQAGGHVSVERSPGLGVEVVWEKVERYAVSN
jgi:muconate cycloisomerase